MLLGPIFPVELVTSARRTRYYLLRVGYALVMLIALWINYESLMFRRSYVDLQQAANFAGIFFNTFSVLQVLAVLLVGPALVAGTIAVERERRTIEYLFASDLTNREIVLGKLCARMLHVVCTLLVGLPILALAMLMGGIAPDRLAVVFLITASTVIAVSALSVNVSVWTARARDAITRTYLILFALVALPLMLQGWLMAYGWYHWTIAAIIDPLVEANPLRAIWMVFSFGGWMSTSPWDVVQPLVIYQLCFSLAMAGAAIWAVRRVYARESGKSASKKKVPARRSPRGPGERPMYWKEAFVARTSGKLGLAGRVAMLLIFIASLLPSISMFITELTSPSPFNALVHVTVGMSTAIACGGLLLVASRSATCITSEIEKDTWTTLLSTPLSGAEVIAGKIYGNLWAARGPALAFAIIWAFQLVLHPQYLVPLVFSAGTFALLVVFASVLGTLYSLCSRNSSRAMGATLATLVFAGGGYMFCCAPVITNSDAMVVILAPVMPFLIACPGQAFAISEQGYGGVEGELVGAYILGNFGYAVVAAVLFAITTNSFDQHTGRIPAPDAGD